MMNNKKGFTLIEVIVSIVLVSVVMVSLLGSLIQLRQTYTVIHEDSDIIVYSSSISRVINNDLAKNNGIRYCVCDPEGKKCDIILGNDNRRILEIKKKTKCYQGSDIKECEETHNKEIIRTTLRYVDNTVDSDEKLVYIRTLEMKKTEKNGSVGATGYGFEDLSTTVYEHDDGSNSSSALVDQYTTILVRLNNEVNEDISKHDIILYSAGRYNYSNLVGNSYQLALNTNTTDEHYAGDTMITEIFGVGYFQTKEDRTVGTQYSVRKLVDIPQNGTKAFLGYYYTPPGYDKKIQVIDSQGRIITSSRFFRDNVDYNVENDPAKAVIKAEWGVCAEGYKIEGKKCVPIKYTVTLNKNGGTGGTSSYQISYQSMTPDIEIPYKHGYQFNGYTSSENGATLHNKNGVGQYIYNFQKNTSATAEWKACDNAAHATGWENNNNCKITQCHDGYTLSNNKCVGNTYTATFNKNGATSVGATTKSCTVSNEIGSCTIEAPSITRSGFTSYGFNTSASATTGSTSFTITKNETYYAITKKEVTITFNVNGNGGSNSSLKCTIWNSATTCNITSPAITPASGFTTIGWSTGATTYTSSWSENTANAVSANATYYAQSTKAGKSISVTYNKGTGVASIGTGSGCTTTAGYNGTQPGTSCSVTLPSITANTGYTAVGWSTTNGATTGSAANTSYSVSANTTLYANATVNSYTLSFNCNGGSGAPGSITVKYGQAISGFPSTVCRKSNSRQTAWTENSNGTGATFGNGTVYNFTSNKTVYAKWSYVNICGLQDTLFGPSCGQPAGNWKSWDYYGAYETCYTGYGAQYGYYNWYTVYCGNTSECAKYGYNSNTTMSQINSYNGCGWQIFEWCTC